MLFGRSAAAQTGFEIVSEENIKEYYEKPVYVPDARISGSYEALAHYKTAGFFRGDDRGSFQRQKFTLNISSEVNRDVYLFLGLTNRRFITGEERGSYYAHNETDRSAGGSSNDNDVTVVIDQAYLAYYSNPCTLFKIGIQEIDPANNNGLVYRGKNSAITNNCTIGTWPYEIGYAVMGSNTADSLKWARLSYPVYSNDRQNRHRTIEPEDIAANKFKESGMDIEIYRINYDRYKSPFSESGAVTWDRDSNDAYNLADVSADNPLNDYTDIHSPYHLKYDDERYLYIDQKIEYYGLNFDWYYYWFALSFQAALRQGEIRYFAGKTGDTYTTGDAGESLESRRTYGTVLRLQNYFFIGDSSQLHFDFMISSGNRAPDSSADSTSDFLNNDMEQFVEVSPGTFENDDKAFFNAYSGAGDGHSVANITYAGVTYKYATESQAFRLTLSAYRYIRTNRVLNADGEKVNFIGNRFGLDAAYYSKSNLKVYSEFVYFIKGEAFTENDNVAPEGDFTDKQLSYANLGIKYTF